MLRLQSMPKGLQPVSELVCKSGPSFYRSRLRPWNKGSFPRLDWLELLRSHLLLWCSWQSFHQSAGLPRFSLGLVLCVLQELEVTDILENTPSFSQTRDPFLQERYFIRTFRPENVSEYLKRQFGFVCPIRWIRDWYSLSLVRFRPC